MTYDDRMFKIMAGGDSEITPLCCFGSDDAGETEAKAIYDWFRRFGRHQTMLLLRLTSCGTTSVPGPPTQNTSPANSSPTPNNSAPSNASTGNGGTLVSADVAPTVTTASVNQKRANVYKSRA